MTVVFPQRAVIRYVNALLNIAGEASRDASTLTRQATKLMDGGTHGRVMGTLRKYEREKQHGAAEVGEIIADMANFMDPKIVEERKQIQAGRAARAEERREKEAAEEKAAWEPGGVHWTVARDQMMADAHALIFAAKTIGDGGERLTRALREYCESEERDNLFDRLAENMKPPPKALPAPSKRRRKGPTAHEGNVVSGPWAS